MSGSSNAVPKSGTLDALASLPRLPGESLRLEFDSDHLTVEFSWLRLYAYKKRCGGQKEMTEPIQYRIVWSKSWDRGEKTVATAAMADAWAAEFLEEGADAIKIIRNGIQIALDELPTLIMDEAERQAPKH